MPKLHKRAKTNKIRPVNSLKIKLKHYVQKYQANIGSTKNEDLDFTNLRDFIFKVDASLKRLKNNILNPALEEGSSSPLFQLLKNWMKRILIKIIQSKYYFNIRTKEAELNKPKVPLNN